MYEKLKNLTGSLTKERYYSGLGWIWLALSGLCWGTAFAYREAAGEYHGYEEGLKDGMFIESQKHKTTESEALE